MTVTRVGIAAGTTTLGFDVLDHRGVPADSFSVAATEADQGDLMYYSDANEVSQCSGDMPATAQYAGFIDNNVYTTLEGQRIDYHGEKVLKDIDPVAVWKIGRVRLTKVTGVVGDNAKVYPASDGGVSATQTGSAPAVGVARKGNGGTSGGPIEVEFNLIGHGA